MQFSISHRSELTKPHELQEFIRAHELYQRLNEHLQMTASIEAKIILAATSRFTVTPKKVLKTMRGLQVESTTPRPPKHVSFGDLDSSAQKV